MTGKPYPYPFMNYPSPQLRLVVEAAAKDAMLQLLDALNITHRTIERSEAMDAVLADIMREHDRQATSGDGELMVVQVNLAMNCHDEMYTVLGSASMLAEQLAASLPGLSASWTLANAIENLLSCTLSRVYGQDHPQEAVKASVRRYREATNLELALCAIDEMPPWEEGAAEAMQQIARKALAPLAPVWKKPRRTSRQPLAITSANGIGVGMLVTWPEASDPPAFPDTHGSVEQLTINADDSVTAFVRASGGLLFTIPVEELVCATAIPPFGESAAEAEAEKEPGNV